MIQNAAREIAHDVVAKQALRLRRTRHDQIVIACACFREDLIKNDPVPNVHFASTGPVGWFQSQTPVVLPFRTTMEG